MVIPKGKKFQITVIDYDFDTSKEKARRDEDLEQLKIENSLQTNEVFKTSEDEFLGSHSYQLTPPVKYIPQTGYKGNATLGQDVNLSLTANFSKPLEGILGKIPHSFDLVYQATTGTSLNNAKFTHLKYWTGTESPEISLQLVFETQVDSYYDVYLPVLELMRLVLPLETSAGFYKSPVPTIKLITEEAIKFFPKANEGITSMIVSAGNKNGPSEKLEKQAAAVSESAGETAGKLKGISANLETTGFKSSINLGNNFHFDNIIIKSVQPTFSTELCYAPIFFYNSKTKAGTLNPYTASDKRVKIFSQTIGALLATSGNPTAAASSITDALPQAVTSIVQTIVESMGASSDMPAFPIRAEVALTFELQVPLTRNIVGQENSINSISNIFPASGLQDTY